MNNDAGHYQVTTAGLAERLGVSVSTIADWVRAGKIPVLDERSSIGGGRPGYLFDLRVVAGALSRADFSVWPAAQVYRDVLEEHIQRAYEAEQGWKSQAEVNGALGDVAERLQGGEREFLSERIDHLEGLVIRLAKAHQADEALGTEDALEVLGIVLSKLEVR